MHCYLCLIDKKQANEPAYAVCQYCGAAICIHHLIEIAPTALSGVIAAKPRRFICSHCHSHIFTPQTPMPVQKQATPPSRKWWHSIWRRNEQQKELDTGEVIAATEALLRRQREVE